MIKLSILIATIEERKSEFLNLLRFLEKQLPENGSVEIVHCSDNREISIGAKRQKLLKMANGEYVCFIDDDDMVHANYIDKILSAIGEGVDCIGFLVAMDGWESNRIICSLSNHWDGWHENSGGYRFVRCPNHLSVLRLEHCLKIGYPDKRGGEDADFSLALKESGLVKTEIFIPEIMYEYRFKHGKRSWV